MSARAWPSVGPHLELADTLVGESGRARVGTWLQAHLRRTHDPTFAAGFSFAHRAFPLPPDAFLQRVVQTGEVRLLGGIRFFGGDVARPFVDVIAWDSTGVPWEALRAAAREAWSDFRPTHLRVLLTAPPTYPDARVDQTLHAARYAEVTASGSSLGVALCPETVDVAHRTATRRYAGLPSSLRADLFAASLDELTACADGGGLHRIEVDGATAGTLAVSGGAVEWLEGDVVIEQVVDARLAGRSIATRAQRALASQAPDTDRLLMGTVDGRNLASRISAERAGRPARLHDVFLPLSIGARQRSGSR